MTTPHKHAALIKQWADGAQIQYKRKDGWLDVIGINPTWNEFEIYRVKPEPKPDVVKYVCLDIDCAKRVTARSNYFSDFAHRCDILMVIFDGETGKLKDAQVLAHE